jgi:DsbC/DsbD-like thiol-disulfide interchange protein
MDRRAVIAGLPLAFFVTRPAVAGMAKPYRLALMIADFDAAANVYIGGLEIELDPGWKTYWRMPGDAGIPPQFDWSRSQNLKSVEVLWPAPHRFSDKGGETIGYKDRVVFPLRIMPDNPDAPVALDLSLFFGVCQDICIPGNGELAATTGRADPAAAALIASFAARVPQLLKPNSPFRVAASKLEMADPPSLILHLEGARDLSGLDIFVEGADFAYFHAPQHAGPGEWIVPFSTQGDPARLRGKQLKLTLVTPDIALEQDVTVA